MRDLRLIGTSDDGARLLVSLPDGEQASLLIDHQLRSALSRSTDRSPVSQGKVSQLALDGEHTLSPRDIQARIRFGQSPEEVADDAGVTVERVLRYANPILQEREHIAQLAAAVGVKRDDHGAVQLLGELAGERLEERGVSREDMNWDAWRRDDGRWEVRLDYLAGDSARSALWIYDPSRKTVIADDDEARWLLAEEPTATVTQLRPTNDTPTGTKARIPDDVAEVIGLVDNTNQAPGEAARSQASADDADRPSWSETTAAAAKPVAEQPQSRRATRSGKSRRASVPSWDEILFGSKKPE